MNWSSWLLSGFLSSLALTTAMSISQGLGLTRMNMPYLVGTFITSRRDRAKIVGLLVQMTIGWVFSLVYVLAFEALHQANWRVGMVFGLFHTLFVLSVGMSVLPSLHPRMASEQRGPNAVRQLEPPGFMALNYGYQTPLWVALSHLLFGALLGVFYHLR